MSSAKPVPPAHQLLDVLRPAQGAQPATDAQAAKAVSDFMALLISLENKHAKKDWSNEYLISNVFGRSRPLKNDAERGAHCRTHLKIAVRQISRLISNLNDPVTGSISAAKVESHKDILTDYVFDLAEIIPWLERKNPAFIYLEGGKNADVHSWQVYLLSRQLAYQSVRSNQPKYFDHKPAQIAAIFVLRQSLELRFERLVGVYPEDRKGKPPRLWHGFHQEFINAYPQFFLCRGFDIKELRPVYDWCSEIVHLAYQPFAWQLDWSLELCGRLLGTRKTSAGQAWNIANAVEIIDVADMQTRFESYFLQNYDHGSWRMTRTKPEALLKNWNSSMAFTSTDYRPVVGRLDWRKRVRKILPSLWSRLRPS